MQVDIDRQRLGNADGVGKLDRATVGQLGGNDVLGQVARGVGSRAVDLGGVLAGEGATAVRRRAAVGVDDDLAAGKAGVAIGSTDHELAGRVDVPVAIVGDLEVAERLADVRLDDAAHLLGVPVRVEMLGRQHDLRHVGGLAVGIAHGDLALGVWAELAGLAIAFMARGGQQFEDLVAVVDRSRHEVRGLAAGIAEHDALVAGTFLALTVGGVVDALADIRRLAVQQHFDLGRLPVEACLLVADLTDRLAGDRLELRRVDHRMAGGILEDVAGLVLLEQRIGYAHLARDDDAVGGGQRLTRDADLPRVHAGLLGFAIDQIDDLVGNTVANFVGMALGDGFRGEEVILPRHGCPLLKADRRAADFGAKPVSGAGRHSSSGAAPVAPRGRQLVPPARMRPPDTSLM